MAIQEFEERFHGCAGLILIQIQIARDGSIRYSFNTPSMATASMATASMATASMATASMATASMATASMATASMDGELPAPRVVSIAPD